MASHKKKTTRPKKNAVKNNKTAPIFFISLIIAAAAGWYISITVRNDNQSATEKENIISTNHPSPSTNIMSTVIPQPKITPPLLQSELAQSKKAPKPTFVPPLPIPQKQEMAFLKQMPQKNSKNFIDSQTMQDSAKIIFAQKRTVIYQEPNITSKQLAVVEKGQELRSYTKQDNWHRITVPRAGIIGWALDNSFKP